MRSAIIPILCLLATKQVSARSITDDDQNLHSSDFKTNLIAEESQHYTGGNLVLNNEEQQVNDILMKYKLKEVDETFLHHTHLDFSKHYFTYKHDIEKSPVYKIIRKMPKGAALHIHSSTMLQSDELLKLTYEDHLYACYPGDKLDLQFSDSIPVRPCDVEWTLLSDLRNASDNVECFDAELKKFLTLYSKDKDFLNSDINKVWDIFNTMHKTIKSLITYRPVREKYIYMGLKKFYEDNIMYVELRTGLHTLYELNGTKHDGMYLTELYKQITEEFIKEHPDFLGIKIILSPTRFSDFKRIQDSLLLAREVKKDMPEIFAGFDLVGQEDLGRPLSDFRAVLSEAKDYNLDYYFHAGETNWLGTTSDENLFDAFELGSKRIGHGYALIKHPVLVDHVLKNDIPLEVNVISNVVLKLVSDVRNHPLASYLAMGVPVVLSSDNPGAWESDALSHDFYVTFMGVASKNADLRLLKTLSLNSIKYSALDVIKKQLFYDIFDKQWKTFLTEVIRAYSSSS